MAPTTPKYNSSFENDGRKRVPKACDRCRLKKVKCDGNMPCPRCKMEDAVCHFGARRKSIERPISAGYVDQLELQQKILIKALKETWRRYGPAQIKNDPSVHDIVKNLGVLVEDSGYQPISQDFKFNERLASPPLTIKTEITPRPSDREGHTSIPSTSSYSSPVESETFGGSADSMTPPSPGQWLPPIRSAIPSISSVKNPSPIKREGGANTMQRMTKHKKTNSRSQAPSFCPLPPRPSFPPTIPTPLTSQYTDAPYATSQNSWSATQNEWSNNMNFDASIMSIAPPNFDQGLEGLGQLADESWNAWIDDHPEYGALAFEFAYCLLLLPVGE